VSTRTAGNAEILWESAPVQQQVPPQIMQYNAPQQLVNPTYDGNFVEWESVISGPPVEAMQTSPRRQTNLRSHQSTGLVREVIVSDLRESEGSSTSGDSWGGDGMYYSNNDSALDQDGSTDSSNE